MLSAVQALMGKDDFWSPKPVIRRSDAGAARVRREIDKLNREEASRTVNSV